MTKVKFISFSNYDNEKMMTAELVGQENIPLNIFIENYDEISSAEFGECLIDIGGISSGYEIYRNKNLLEEAHPNTAEKSLIPIGTFPVKSNYDRFKPNPQILFSGEVVSVDYKETAADDEPNYYLEVETYGMRFVLFINTQDEIRTGDIIYGVAWLFGVVSLQADEEIEQKE